MQAARIEVVEVAQPAAPSAGTNGPTGSNRHVRVEPPPAAEPRDRPVAARGARGRRSRRPSPGRRSGTCRCTTRRSPRPSRGARARCCRRRGPGPSRRGAGGVAGGGQPLDVVRLPGREVDAGQEDEREVGAVSRDGRLEILGPDEVLAGARPDDDEVRRRIQAALRRGGWSARGGRTGRAGRRPGSAGAGPTGRKNEANRRWRFDGQAVEQRRPRPVARRRSGPSTRGASASQREPRPPRVEPGVDAEAGPGVELRRDRRRPRSAAGARATGPRR